MAEQIIMKTCRVCNETKPITEFPKHSGHKDGHRNLCKSCYNKFRHAYYVKIRQPYLKTEEGKEASCKASQRFRKKHPLRVKEIFRKYHRTEKYRKKQERYQQSEKFKASCKRYRQSEAGKATIKRQKEKYPERHKARIALTIAIKDGKLPPANSLQCSCGQKAKQYHHHKGYEPEHWLDVIPLCTKCHGKTRLIS